MKKIFLILFFAFSIQKNLWAELTNGQYLPPSASFAQETAEGGNEDCLPQLHITAEAPPDYGSLLIDWGFNFLRDAPAEMALGFWGSRFADVCFYYNIRLGTSHFVISPGIGLAFEGYQFEKKNTLVRSDGDRDTIVKEASELFPKNQKIHHSVLDARYVDLMLEARVNADSKYPKESFFAAIGGKVGMLWQASTTVSYKEDTQTKTCTHTEGFNLNQLRYGLQARVGWGRFGLCYTHLFATLFQKDKGPEKTTTQPCSLGLSVDLF